MTVVIEQPSLPIPSALHGPRHDAIAAAVDELERLGAAQVTILVAGGLLRTTAPREIGLLVPPEFRRRFRGRVVVHDAEADDLVEVGSSGSTVFRVNPALVETDLVLTVTAAETVLNGGPAALLGAANAEPLRVATALSLLEPTSSPGWRLAVELERLLADARSGPRGVARAEPAARRGRARRLSAGSGGDRADAPLARPAALQLAPTGLRQRMLDRLPREHTAVAVYGGRPSVAHAEALLRMTMFRGTELAEPLDAIVIGIPSTTPFMPRERPNPGERGVPRPRPCAPDVAERRRRSGRAAR